MKKNKDGTKTKTPTEIQPSKRKIEKLRATLHLLDDIDKPKNTHTIFVDTDQEKRHLDLAKHFDTAPELLLSSLLHQS